MPLKTFSLVLATHGRVQEVDKFLQSIALQEYDLSAIEVLIVDQNGNNGINLAPILDRYRNMMEIRHIKSEQRGLSLSRNIALRLTNGRFVAFPDDDCLYYPDTLGTAERIINSYPDVDIVLGRIVERITHKNMIRKWENTSFPITLHNFYLNLSSITMFCRKNNLFFDETLGLGTYYGSNEDADYIVQSLKRGQKIQYNPAIEVWHPENPPAVDFLKVYSYGLGFGGLCRKHQSLFFLLLFAKVLIYHSALMVLSAAKLDKSQAERGFLSVKSRIHGFISYGRQIGRKI